MDESQAMPLETLETLRLLTNLETEKRKLLQVVLFGQPELDRKLASESIRQLRQRITFHYDLKGLDREEIGAYVEHRLADRRVCRRAAVRWRRAARAASRESRRAAPGQHSRAQGAAARVTARGGSGVVRRHVRASGCGHAGGGSHSASWWWPRLRAEQGNGVDWRE